MPDEELVKVNVDFVVTETTVDAKIPVEKIVSWLRKQKATGLLQFHISQGGVQKVSLTERTKVGEEKRQKVRGLLGI
jgi:hypothetical protein